MTNDAGTSLDVLSPQRHPTEAGNYFVANYPPFSLWTADANADALARLDQPGDPNTPLGMYVHIPFCRKRCHFCYFRVYTDKNSDEIYAYLDAMIAEAANFARSPFINGRRLSFIYFGGGTPSYLSVSQLEYLFNGLQKALPWDEAEEIAFECEPGTLNPKKLAALADMGITRLSLGIENFDDNVLELNNRAHQSKQVYSAYEAARTVGYQQINIDLIAGMLGETDDNWRRCIETTIELSADVVTIYQMEVPRNTTIYRQMRDAGLAAAPVADWPTKRRWVSEAFDALIGAGYSISSAYTAVKKPETTKFVYRDALWSGADMLGVGVSSFGHLAGVHYQNQSDITAYVEQAGSGKLPLFRALSMTDDHKIIRQFILQMKLGHLRRQSFVDKFAVDVFARWHDVLQQYQEQNYLTFDNDQLRLTRRGLLEVDRLLHAFFLPEHQGIHDT